MPTVQFGKRPGRTRGRPQNRATADGIAKISYAPPLAQGGTDVVADVQTVTSDGTGGTFTIDTAGDVTGTIAWDATIGTVETAIETLDEYTAATVTGSAGAWVITSNDGAGLPGETLIVDNTLLTGGTAVNVHTTVGVANVYESFTLVTEGDTGTGFTITIDGNTSGAIDEDDDADAIEIIVEAITGITACEVTGLGTRKSPFIVSFTNPAGDVATATSTVANWSSTVVVASRGAGTDRE